MVSRSGANCPTDAAAKSTMKQTKAETHAKPDKGEAAVAASPGDPKVKEEKESKREVHQRKAERKPAVAASHSERARPHTNTQAQDSTSCEYTSYSGAESSYSDASSSRDRSTSSDVGSPSLDNGRRHRVSRSKYRTRRRSGGHGKGTKPSSMDITATGKPRAASRCRSKRRPAKAPKLDSSGGEGKAEAPSHRAQRGGYKGNNRSRGRSPLSRRHLPPDQAQPCRSAAAHTSRRDSKGFAFGPPPDPPQPTLSPSRSGGNGAAGHTTKCSINAVIAHVVVTEEADVRDLVRMFSSTRASIVVVSYDKWHDERSTIQEKMVEAFRRFGSGPYKWDTLWMTIAAAFVKTARISTAVEKLSITSDTHRFTVVECQNRESHVSASGLVTLGLVASASDAGAYQVF